MICDRGAFSPTIPLPAGGLGMLRPFGAFFASSFLIIVNLTSPSAGSSMWSTFTRFCSAFSNALFGSSSVTARAKLFIDWTGGDAANPLAMGDGAPSGVGAYPYPLGAAPDISVVGDGLWYDDKITLAKS